MSCRAMKREFMTALQAAEWARSEKRTKQSFWPSDCLKSAVEIYWKWTNEPETNPIEPEKLLMFKAANMFEKAVIEQMIKIGDAVDLNDEDAVKRLGLNVSGELDEWGKRQVRVEMEREYVPITGYMDGISPEGYPIEIKSYYSTKVDSDLEKGKPPALHYLHQLACYMDYIQKDRGYLVSVNRSTGNLYITELVHKGNLIYEVGDRCAHDGIQVREEPSFDPDEAEPYEEEDFVGTDECFDLGAEYKRFRKIMEDNILPRKQPVREYEYRPAVTKELLEKYTDDKIKKAIKGERVLSSHNWRPQYCNWKDLWIKQEMDEKGFTDMEEFCRYTMDETQYMMDFLNVEWKETKRGRLLYKKKPAKKA